MATDEPDFDGLYERARRRLAGDLNAAQWPVGFAEALAAARAEAERAYSAATGSRAEAEEAYDGTFDRTYDRVRVRGGLG